MALDDKINDACHRIEELWYETDGKCFVAFSGGKDSTVLLALVKMCEEVYTIPENAIPAVFCNTGIELGVTLDFIKWVKGNWYQNVVIVYPEKSFDWILKNKGKPMKSKMKSEYLERWGRGARTPAVVGSLVTGVLPTGNNTARKTRLADKDMHMLSDDFEIKVSNKCCEYLKKRATKQYEKESGAVGSILGIRIEEGGSRQLNAQRRVKSGGKLCTFQSHGKTVKAPIIDWTDEDIDGFVKRYNVPLSKAYTVYGFRRTGCMACPYSQALPTDLQYLHDYEPNRYKAAMHWMKDVYIAQNVILPFDEEYEKEREKTWREVYEPMRQEMLRKYRPNSKLIKDQEQTTIFEFLGE